MNEILCTVCTDRNISLPAAENPTFLCLIYCVSILILSHIALGSIPVAARSKAWVCSRLLTGIVGSKPSGSMNVSLFMSVVCCQVEVSATG
jgi:hypothetical protein